MEYKIEKAAVMGAGVMGSTIAAHLANVGIPCYLMDIVPGELTEQEKTKKLTLESPEVRNRFATLGIHLGKQDLVEPLSRSSDCRLRLIPFGAMLPVGMVAALLWSQWIQ